MRLSGYKVGTGIRGSNSIHSCLCLVWKCASYLVIPFSGTVDVHGSNGLLPYLLKNRKNPIGMLEDNNCVVNLLQYLQNLEI